MTENILNLWTEYKKNKTIGIRNKLIEHYYQLSYDMARLSYKKIHRDNAIISFDDLHNESSLALIESIDKYNPNTDAKFETFCRKRLYFSTIDYIRNNCFTRRSKSKKSEPIYAFSEMEDTIKLKSNYTDFTSNIRKENIKKEINKIKNKKNRIIFKMYYIKGMTPTEIGIKFKYTSNGIYFILNRSTTAEKFKMSVTKNFYIC